MTFSEQIMGTRIEATLPEGGAIAPEESAAVVFEIFHEVDGWASGWTDGSTVATINGTAGGEPVPAGPELIELLQRGVALGDLTGGTFDITWAALWDVWDFTAQPPRLPDPVLLARQLEKVDHRRVEIDEDAGTVRLPEAGMRLGLGGIAKGYALDLAGEALRGRGLDSFSLSAGGQVLAAGLIRPVGESPRPWRVGVREPRGSVEDFFATVEVTDMSVATSGDYERYFSLDGVRYHHILDLRTGQPSRAARSATVICEDATLADALSTALMVMGASGLSLIEAQPGVEGLLVDVRGRIHTSSGLDPMLRIRHLPRP